ncbi:MAG: hypothetical protein CMJ25_31505 [Phycisphaerae bacterium]|nr:hypothetical protein [Phycisphaerae bacterium]
MSLANLKKGLDGDLELYGELMVTELRKALAVKYPYAPGYNGSRGATGSANKIGGIPSGYQSNLYNSIESKYDVESQEVEILMNEYWQWVNDGRRPGSYAPIKPLQQWAMQRLGLNSEDAKSAAFGISKNLQKFGIAPTYFYDLAIENLETTINDDLFKDIETSVEDFLEHLVEETISPDNNIEVTI